jgi:hypothetical protein
VCPTDVVSCTGPPALLPTHGFNPASLPVLSGEANPHGLLPVTIPAAATPVGCCSLWLRLSYDR